VILFAGRLSPRIKPVEARGVEADLSIAGGAATPAASTDGYSAATAAGDGSDG
jgi:hypothetical protein